MEMITDHKGFFHTRSTVNYVQLPKIQRKHMITGCLGSKFKGKGKEITKGLKLAKKLKWNFIGCVDPIRRIFLCHQFR